MFARSVYFLQATALAAALFVLATFELAVSQERKVQTPKVIDYMVVTVNGSLITYSDLLWQLALQPGSQLDNPSKDELRRALDLVIDQRLISTEAEKLPHLHATDKEIDQAIAELIRLFSSTADFQQRLQRTGMTSERLREIMSARVDIEKYLNFRFRSFVVVTSKETEDYYRDVFVPRFRQRSPGSIVPKIEDVRAEIEKTLQEGKVASDLQKYIDESRDRAEIVMIREP